MAMAAVYTLAGFSRAGTKHEARSTKAKLGPAMKIERIKGMTSLLTCDHIQPPP